MHSNHEGMGASPLPDVPSRIEALGLEWPRMRATWGNLLAARHPVRELLPDERPSSWLARARDLELDTNEATPDAPFDEASNPRATESAPERVDAESARIGVETASLDVRAGSFAAPARSGTISTADHVSSVTTAQSEETPSTLSGPQRYSVQFTASEEYVALVEEATALLGHALPSADIAEVHLRAMRAFVAALKKRKFALSGREPAPRDEARRATACAEQMGSGVARTPAPVQSIGPARGAGVSKSSPDQQRSTERLLGGRPATDWDVNSVPDAKPPASPVWHDGSSSSCSGVSLSAENAQSGASLSARSTESPRQRERYVVAAVRRAVFERDGQRCAFVDVRGERCRETTRLEFHHREPFARGGPSTPENLSLYCAAHNALAAEGDFGREVMTRRRADRAHLSERRAAREGLNDA